MKKAILTLLLLIPLVACDNQATESVTSSIQPINITNLKATPQGHFSEAQLKYLTSEDYTDTTPYNGNMSVSNPLPVNITCESEATGPFTIEISEKEKNTKITYTSETNSFDFYNPFFNSEYEAVVYKDVSVVERVSFKEEIKIPGPRNLKIDGVENFRDIGGWGYLDNNQYKPYMKQGMVYRSGRFNEDKANPVNVTISESGIYEALHNLHIRTEIDLRRTSTNEVGSLSDKSVLGEDINYYQYPMAYGGNNILTFKGKLSGDDYEYDNPSMIKNVMLLFGDINNYPIVFHCSIGKDRTGCIAYLLEGLLGFSQETMYRDYMFTNFADAGMCKMTDITSRYGKTLDEYTNGDTLQQKVFNYLKDEIGVPEECLNNIINNLKA